MTFPRLFLARSRLYILRVPSKGFGRYERMKCLKIIESLVWRGAWHFSNAHDLYF